MLKYEDFKVGQVWKNNDSCLYKVLEIQPFTEESKCIKTISVEGWDEGEQESFFHNGSYAGAGSVGYFDLVELIEDII